MVSFVRRRAVLASMAGLMVLFLLGALPRAALAEDVRIDLKVLVVTDGGATVSAIEKRLEREGVPHQTVRLNDADRPVIDADFLSGTVDGTPRAKFQAVVLPNAAPFGDAAEATALADYERRFGVRQLDAYVYPNAAVGLNPPGYAGSLDGVTANVTATGLGGAFRYLKGPVPFEDAAAGVSESYGYLADPVADDPAQGTSFQPYLTATANGVTGTLAGVYTHDGREEMELSFAADAAQPQFQEIGHGLITWLTKGVHLGYDRNYFDVHVDDVFLGDSRWSTDGNCTPGEDCPGGVTTPDIRMTADDVSRLTSWQDEHDFTLDMVFNGGGSDDAVEDNGSDPLTDAFVAHKSAFRWVNHTYDHAFLGCEQDTSVRPWKCVTDASGAPVYASRADIEQEITKNAQWAAAKGIDTPAGELVTGEHSGLLIQPQQPDDNPNLAPALASTGVTWLASDASRGAAQRTVGPARTVPRHPLDVFFNVATPEEEVDEYNWIYTSRADGGSGICEDNPETVTCISPLDPATGYASYIIPVNARIAMSHILGNDPRPHYVHQANLAEGRILYPLLDRVLADYRALFADDAPLVQDRMSALGTELARQDAWSSARDDVTAYVEGGRLMVRPPDGVDVPVTVPDGTSYGGAYAGERSGYQAGDLTLTLPATTS